MAAQLPSRPPSPPPLVVVKTEQLEVEMVSSARADFLRRKQSFAEEVAKADREIEEAAAFLAGGEGDDGDEIKKKKKRVVRVDYVAAKNAAKKLGGFPEYKSPGAPLGLEVGDTFSCRAEMRLLGVHGQYVSGISFVPWKDMSVVATAVVLNCGKSPYRDNKDCGDTIVYSGEGGLPKPKKSGKDKEMDASDSVDASTKKKKKKKKKKKRKNTDSSTGSLKKLKNKAAEEEPVAMDEDDTSKDGDGALDLVPVGDGGEVVMENSATGDDLEKGGGEMVVRTEPKSQTLTRGNLALQNSMQHNLLVGVIRGYRGKQYGRFSRLYSYDGLYRVTDMVYESGVLGNDVYKFILERVKNQKPIRFHHDAKAHRPMIEWPPPACPGTTASQVSSCCSSAEDQGSSHPLSPPRLALPLPLPIPSPPSPPQPALQHPSPPSLLQLALPPSSGDEEEECLAEEEDGFDGEEEDDYGEEEDDDDDQEEPPAPSLPSPPQLAPLPRSPPSPPRLVLPSPPPSDEAGCNGEEDDYDKEEEEEDDDEEEEKEEPPPPSPPVLQSPEDECLAACNEEEDDYDDDEEEEEDDGDKEEEKEEPPPPSPPSPPPPVLPSPPSIGDEEECLAAGEDDEEEDDDDDDIDDHDPYYDVVNPEWIIPEGLRF